MRKDKNSNIFHDLAALNGAGIDMLEAVKIIASSHLKVTVWPVIISRIANGSTLAKALGDCGVINSYEQEIIAVAEFAGRTEQALSWLAKNYEKRLRRISQLRYKLLLPLAVLLIGIIAFSILTLVKNPEVTVLSVVSQAGIILVAVFVITKVMLFLFQKDISNFIASSSLLSHSKLYKRLFEQVFFTALLWNNKSGIDFKTGFLRLSKLTQSKSLKKRLMMASAYCGQGLTITKSIQKAELPVTIEFIQILEIAQASGRWDETVEHYLNQQQVMLDMKIDSVVEWLPRIYYLFIVAFVGSIIN
jgi:type II secretory pathway component PulF